jgi:hypothetical protein
MVIKGDTGGASATSLLAVEDIKENEPLVPVNGDQVINCEYLDILKVFNKEEADTGTIIFKSVRPRDSR